MVTGNHGAALRQLRLLRRADLHMRRRPVADRTVLGCWPDVVDYLRARQGYQPDEELRALFLDQRNRLIREERLAVGTESAVRVDIRELIRRALLLDAAAMILAHNHPSGDPEPSAADRDVTRAINRAVTPVGIKLHDHLILVPDGYTSFRERGLI